MTDACDHEAILAAGRSRRSANRARAIRDAYLDPHADQILARMLDESDDLVFTKPSIAAHLGDFAGAHGDAALRRAFRASGPGTTDARCASLLALAKRAGLAAMPELMDGLTAANTDVKDYAVVGLAGVGDDTAWDQVLRHLRSVIRRRRKSPQVVAYALAYLARHVSDPTRRLQLVTFARASWDIIDQAEWFLSLWPEAAPDGADANAVNAPTETAIQEWVRQGLFRPLGAPLG